MDNQPQKPADTNDSIKQAVEAIRDIATEYKAKTVRDKRWTTAKRVFYICFIATCVLGYAGWLHHMNSPAVMGAQKPNTVAMIKIDGDIAPNTATDADTINPLIKRACADKNVKSILLSVNSPGGSPIQAARIIAEMDNCRANHHKPITALIGGMAASAAYMISMHADHVYASKYSMVGSIGALITYYDLSGVAKKLGIGQEIFRSAPLKGGPSMISGTSPEDAAIFQSTVKSMGQLFLSDVVKTRGKKLHTDTTTLFTGQLWTADQAMQMGLIDQETVLEKLENGPLKGDHVVVFDNRTPMQKMFSTTSVLNVAHAVFSSLATPQVQ